MEKSASDLYLLAWQRVRELELHELLKFVNSKSTTVRELVVQEMHIRGSEDVFRAACSLTASTKARVRSAGFLVLGQLGTPERPFRAESVPILLDGLERERTILVRCSIAYAIGHLGIPEAQNERIIERLVDYLESGNRSVDKAVAFSIAGLCRTPALELLVAKIHAKCDEDLNDWVTIGLDAVRERSWA